MNNRKSLAGPFVIGVMACCTVGVTITVVTGVWLHWLPIGVGSVVTLWTIKALTSREK